MVRLLAGQRYLITWWTVRRQTVGVAAISAHPLSYRRLIILRLVALCSFSRVLFQNYVNGFLRVVSATARPPWQTVVLEMS